MVVGIDDDAARAVADDNDDNDDDDDDDEKRSLSSIICFVVLFLTTFVSVCLGGMSVVLLRLFWLFSKNRFVRASINSRRRPRREGVKKQTY